MLDEPSSRGYTELRRGVYFYRRSRETPSKATEGRGETICTRAIIRFAATTSGCLTMAEGGLVAAGWCTLRYRVASRLNVEIKLPFYTFSLNTLPIAGRIFNNNKRALRRKVASRLKVCGAQGPLTAGRVGRTF